MKCRECPIEIDNRPCKDDVGRFSVDDACEPVERMVEAERRLRDVEVELATWADRGKACEKPEVMP